LRTSLVTRRRTLCSWLSMMVRATTFTFSRASASSTCARRPGLFSRNTDTCLAVSIGLTSREEKFPWTETGSERRLYSKSRRAHFQQNPPQFAKPPPCPGPGGSGDVFLLVWHRLRLLYYSYPHGWITPQRPLLRPL